MTSRRRAVSEGAVPPFRFVGGDASLDFVNTVDWTTGGPSNERLVDYEHLTRWAQGAGILTGRDAERLRAIARSHPMRARAALAKAFRLRSALRRLLASAGGFDARSRAWKDFNDLLAGALQRLEVKPGNKRAEWAWKTSAGSLTVMLPPLLWSAARLLTSEEAPRISVCSGPDCGWMYVDRSRNGLRRWCRMETCGTREKSRRRRERKRRRRPLTPSG